MYSTLILFILSTAVVAGAEGPLPDEGIRLTYRLANASTLKYDAISTSKQTISVMDRVMVSTVQTNLNVVMKVRETVLQRSTIDVTYDQGTIRTQLETNDGVMAQDTSVDLYPVKDLRLSITMAPNGAVMSTSIEAAHQHSAETMSMLRSTRIFDRLLVPFPTHDVIPGDKWETDLIDTTIAPQGLGSVITRGTVQLTFQGVVDTLGMKCWKIGVSSNDLEQAGEFTNPSMIMKLQGTGTIKGASYHDVSSGAVVVSTSVWDAKIVMDISGQQRLSVPVASRIVLDLKQRRSSN